MGSSFRLSDFFCNGAIREKKARISPVNVPPLSVDSLDRDPPESEYEEDQTREYGCEEAFHNSYWWCNLVKRREPSVLQCIG